MQEELRSVESKEKLAVLWRSNAASIASLPEPQKISLISLKDEVKARF
jgi:hypothetical protein